MINTEYFKTYYIINKKKSILILTLSQGASFLVLVHLIVAAKKHGLLYFMLVEKNSGVSVILDLGYLLLQIHYLFVAQPHQPRLVFFHKNTA